MGVIRLALVIAGVLATIIGAWFIFWAAGLFIAGCWAAALGLLWDETA